MSREISFESMVQLPRLSGASAVVLGEQLLTTAGSAEDLPVFIERPRARLSTAVTSLKNEIIPKEKDSKVEQTADRMVDTSWGCFADWLHAIVKMPDGSVEGLDKARTLYTLIFSEGLSFIILSYREEWTKSESKLTAIEDGNYEETIRALGGGLFLDNLKSAHANYGVALGIKAPVSVTVAPAIRENMNKLAAAMKEYVVKVVAYADPEEPGSEALSQTLMAPLVNWKDGRSNTASEGEKPDK